MAFQADIERTVLLARDSCSACLGKQRSAEFIRQRAHKRVAALSKGLQGGALPRTILGFCEAKHAANDTARSLFGFVELWERASKTEPLRISRINPGNERAYQAIEQLWRKFSADESGDGFIAIGRNAFSEDVAHEGPFGGAIDERTHEKRRRTEGHGLEFAADQNISRCTWRSLNDLVRNAEVLAQVTELDGAAKALGAAFQQETVAHFGADDTAGAGASLDQSSANSGFAQSVGTDEAGDATADHQCWDVTSHGDVSILVGSESFRKERLGDELLFFEIRVENHGQIADEDAAEPSGAHFAAVHEYEPILAGRFQATKRFGETLVKVDDEFAWSLVLDHDGMTQRAADDGAAQTVLV